jgi:hypothetical protein
MDPFRGERLAKLKQHPAWNDLVAEVDAAANRHWESVTRTLKAGVDLDLEDLRLKREYYRGMRAVLDMPDRGAKAIEKHLQKGEVSTA